MDQVAKEKTLDILTKADPILVLVSKNSGFDGVASGLALHISLTKLGKNAAIVAPKPTVHHARSLYSVDKIGKSGAKSNLVVVIENAVASVDKVTYFLDGSRLKIIVHPLPGEKSVSKEDISFEEVPQSPKLIFAIGFSTREEMQNEITHEQNLDPNSYIVAINNQPLKQKFAQIEFSSNEARGISEVATQAIQDLAMPMDEDIAYNLYAGLWEATENFSPALSTPNTFEIAKWLIKFGAGKASLASEFRGLQQTLQAPVADNQTFDFQSTRSQAPQMPQAAEETPIEQVEREKKPPEEDWLKPPKIYKGSKSFDSES